MNKLLLPTPPDRVQHIKWALVGVILSWTLAAWLASFNSHPVNQNPPSHSPTRSAK